MVHRLVAPVFIDNYGEANVELVGTDVEKFLDRASEVVAIRLISPELVYYEDKAIYSIEMMVPEVRVLPLLVPDLKVDSILHWVEEIAERISVEDLLLWLHQRAKECLP